MIRNRRDFLKTAGLAAAGLSLPFSGKSGLLSSFAPDKKAGAFGIQLWTVKENLAADPKGTLASLAQYGYNQIESFEGPNGMFWGMKNTEFKKYMDDLGMKIVSSHANNTVDFERKAAEAAEIGMKYLICPYKGPQKSIDDFKGFADEFNKAGEICKKNGIRFAYHNHDYSFKELDGKIPQVVMMEGTDPKLVDYEMDIYWVVAANEDPIKWFKKYPNRFRLCHVKDQTKSANGGIESCHLGTGTIGFGKLLAEARKYGLQYHIVEQEAFTGSTPLKSAEIDAAYMKKLVG
ncbi:MAG: TIM barrel protein [Sphingobacteriia bacterium]|nr:TIM barrel protein [Sphingobacteriia bacterium]